MRYSFLLLLAAVGLWTSPAAAQTPIKVGYINSQAILEQAPGAREAMEQFDEEMASLRSRLQPAADSLDQLIQAYEAQAMTMSADAKQRREQDILQRREALQQRASQLETEAGQRREELVQPVMDRINTVIEAMRVEGGYHLIFDVAAGSIIAADESLDLTSEVVRRLQAAPGSGS
jgi:outer membrane protein